MTDRDRISFQNSNKKMNLDAAIESTLEKTKDSVECEDQSPSAVLAMKALETEIEEHQGTEAKFQQSQEQLHELSRKILEHHENERKLLAQEIHDSISGGLAAIKLALEEKLESMGSNPKPDIISLEKIIFQVNEMIKESRRISSHLRPSLLDDMGLLPTISWLCREFEQLHREVKIEQQLDISEDEIPEKLKVVIYRVLQEAMNNVAKHSEATQVNLKLDKRNNRIDLSVADNGNGFDIEKQSSESNVLTGYGISSMRDRISLCDGDFEIFSEKAKGTTVCISLPYKDE